MKAYFKKKYIYCGLFILFMQLHYWLNMSRFSKLPGFAYFRIACFVFALGCLFFHFAITGTKLTRGTWIIVGGLMVLGVVGVFTVDGLTIIKMFLFALAIKDVPIRTVINWFLYSTLFIVIMVTSCSFLGIIENYSAVGSWRYYYLGFNNSNTAALIFFTCIVSYIYLHYTDFGLKNWAIIVIATVVVGYLTISRSFVVAMIILMLFMTIDKFTKNFRRHFLSGIFSPVLGFFFPMFFGVSFYIAAMFSDSSLWMKVNLALSWRPYFYHKYYSYFNISLLGNNFELADLGPLDNAYLMLLFRYGVVILLVYMAIFAHMSLKSLAKKNYIVVFLCVAYEAYFVMEYSPFMINANIPLLFFFANIWKNKDKRYEYD